MEPVGSITRTRREIRDPRRWLIPLGILFVVLGGIAILAAFATTLATVLLFGVLLLFGGIAQLAQALAFRGEDFVWELVRGIVYVLVGVLLILDPVGGAIGLTLLLALFFLFVGVLQISLALRLRRAYPGWGAFLATGAIDLVLGFLIVFGWPGTAGWVIGLFLGIELLFAGTCLLLLTTSARRRASTTFS